MNRPPKQTTIYIGLNDSETGVQRFPSEKYLSILKHACKSYKVAFSVQEINGGYFHENGRYTEENTLVLSLMDVLEQTVMELAKDLCAFFPSGECYGHVLSHIGCFRKGNDLIILMGPCGRRLFALKEHLVERASHGAHRVLRGRLLRLHGLRLGRMPGMSAEHLA